MVSQPSRMCGPRTALIMIYPRKGRVTPHLHFLIELTGSGEELAFESAGTENKVIGSPSCGSINSRSWFRMKLSAVQRPQTNAIARTR